jgi:hypothetical protein
MGSRAVFTDPARLPPCFNVLLSELSIEIWTISPKGHRAQVSDLVYQIDLGVTRLLWIGKERTIESFQGFFTTMGGNHIKDRVHLLRHVGTLLEGYP